MFVGKDRITTVDRGELLVKLRANLAVHNAEYISAQYKWEEALREWTADLVQRVDVGDFTDLAFTIMRPSSNAKDIERAIAMVSMSTEETIQLDEHTFAQWVLGEWTFRAHLNEIAFASASLAGALRSKKL